MVILRMFISSIIVISFMSCSKDIYSVSNKTYNKKSKQLSKQMQDINAWQVDGKTVHIQKSQNFTLRKPNYVIIHHTAQDSCEQTYRTFSLERTGVSSHYVVCRDGTITQMLDDYLRGHHAGVGKWGSITDMNSISIGIELDNNGREEFSEPLITSLIFLLTHLKETYDIPTENFIGHSDWAPGRKVDPSKYFPWKRLAENGIGLWYNEEELNAINLPSNFNPEIALRIIGYDTKNTEHAIYSFKLHYNADDEQLNTLTDYDKKILFVFMQNLLTQQID